MNSPTEMLSPEQFSASLLSVLTDYPFEKTRVYQLLMSRKCPLSLIQRYARSTFLGASLFSTNLIELVEKAPNDKAKLTLLKNLLEEEGIHMSPTKGLVVRPEARHSALALRFATACGASQELDKNPLHTMHLARDYLSQDRWLEAVAFLLVGQELKFAHVSTLIMHALMHQGYTERELAFFAVHREADKRHGQEALNLVIDNSHSKEQQNAALQAAREGAHHWFSMHGGAAKKHLSRSDAGINA